MSRTTKRAKEQSLFSTKVSVFRGSIIIKAPLSIRCCRKIRDRYILNLSPFAAVGGCDGAVFKDASHCWSFNEAQSDSSPDLKGNFPAQLKVFRKAFFLKKGPRLNVTAF